MTSEDDIREAYLSGYYDAVSDIMEGKIGYIEIDMLDADDLAEKKFKKYMEEKK